MLTPQERAELEEILERARAQKKQNVLSGLFPEQKAFIEDPARFKAALCSRRAGKTFGITRALVDACQKHPGTISAYITLTRPNAKRLVWTPLKMIDREHDLGLHFHNTDLVATFPNGSQLIVTGASDEPDIEKLRGLAYQMVVIDECASFPSYIEPLIEEVIEPALEDHAGTLMVIGTPGGTLAGYFYDITTYPEKYGYSLHKWTVRDNSKFPIWAGLDNWREVAEVWERELMKRKGYDDKNPKFLREYKGLWVEASDSLMYHISPDSYMTPEESAELDRRIADKDPDLRFAIGNDLGWHDNTAFYVLAYDSKRQMGYEVEGMQQTELYVGDIARIDTELIERYDPDTVRIDSAGEGKIIVKSLAEEIGKRFSLPVEAAEKTKKASFVRLWDSDIKNGFFKFRPNSELADQMKRLQWDKKYKREREGLACDRHDASLYAFRELKHWAKESVPDKKPDFGTPEYYQWVADEIERKEDEAASMENNSPDWY